MHEGIDIAAPVGTSIVAPAEGVVIFSGRKSGYGLTVVIDHGGEISTLFGHNSKVFVHEGDKVTKGQEISRVGNSGTSTGPHLHYEVHRDGAPVDPSEFI
jgi:murein DD-endopeptidase MepM/ murein hydrolase activator NlpD